MTEYVASCKGVAICLVVTVEDSCGFVRKVWLAVKKLLNVKCHF